jgi:hypothetical protein
MRGPLLIGIPLIMGIALLLGQGYLYFTELSVIQDDFKG